MRWLPGWLPGWRGVYSKQSEQASTKMGLRDADARGRLL